MNEEAAHAVVAALMGLRIREARMDWPDTHVAGHVVVSTVVEPVNSLKDFDRGYYKRLLAVLAGPVFVGYWESLKWPLDVDDSGDVGIVARLCKWLKYELVDLFVAETRVKTLLRDDRVHQAIKAVGTELLEHGAIRGARVHELVAEAEVDPAVVMQALFPLGRPHG